MNRTIPEKRIIQSFLSLFLAVSILLSASATAAAEGVRFADGTWSGTGTGYGGDVTVQVTIQNGSITEITGEGPNESPTYWNRATALFETIVERQSTDVDVISGATRSSNGIKQAVTAALREAADAATENDPFSGGTGTAQDPYQISNANQLATLAATVDAGEETYANQYVVLTKDIDLSQVENWNPIGGEANNAANLFQGTFDGKGHTVSGMKITGAYTSETNVGLFSALGAEAVVRNVNLTDVSITVSGTGLIRAGAVAGMFAKGEHLLPLVDCCSAAGVISVTVNAAALAYSGGIVGWMQQNSAITNCWTDVDLNCVSAGGTNSAYAGGIAGVTGNNIIIVNCATFGDNYANAPLSTNFGGMAGGISAMLAGKLWNTYAMGNSTIGNGGNAHTWVGALAGQGTTSGMTKVDGVYVYPDEGALREFGYFPSDLVLTEETWSDAVTREKSETVPLSAFGTGTLNHDSVFQGTALSRGDMSGNAFAETMNGNLKSVSNLMAGYGITGLPLNKWEVGADGKVLPTGKVWTDPAPDETLFAGGTGTAADPYLILTADQMKSFAASLNNGVDYTNYCIQLNDDIDLSGEDWTPVGGSDYAFNGTFDGNGHTISGLRIGSDNEVKTLGENDVYIGLFGVLNEKAVIRNVFITDMSVNVYRDNYGDSLHVGGIAGAMQGASIDHCSVQGKLTATTKKQNTFTAGIVGLQYKGSIINSWTDTDLSCTVQTGDSIAEVGGLVALNNRGLVANCYTLGDVYGSASRENGDEGMASISGLIGVNAGSLANCYSAGSHTTGQYSHYVGAASGWVTGIGKTYNCWYNGEAAMRIGDRTVSPVESIGTKVPGGVSDEGDVYTGGVVDKLIPYTEADYQNITQGLNDSFGKYPIDITKFGLETNALRTWTVQEGTVTLTDETQAVTYEQPAAEFVPVVPQVMRDGTWIGRDKDQKSVVTITVRDNAISDVKTDGETEGDAFDAALAKAQEKAVYGDTSGYGAMEPAKFAGGKGTKSDPYQIKNEAQLRYLAEALNEDESFRDIYFKQTADISLKGGDWLPIGWGIMAEIKNQGSQYCVYPFLGHFDGGNYTISGLNIGTSEQPSKDPRVTYLAGLFGLVSGDHNSNAAFAGGERINELKNINLKDVEINISGRYQNFAGALAGNVQKGFIIDNCHVSGSVTACSQDSFARAGGLAGNALQGIVTNSSAAVNVSGNTDAGNSYIGGFYAMDNRVTTVNCYCTGNATGNSGNNNKTHIGGFVGQAGGAKYNCYASGDVVAEKTTGDVGGINGRLAGIAVDSRCYYNSDARQEVAGIPVENKSATGVVVPKNPEANQTEGKSADEMKSEAFVALLNENLTGIASTMTALQETINNGTDLEHTVLYTGDGSDLKEWKLVDGIAGFEKTAPTEPLAEQTITGVRASYSKTYGDKAFALGAKAEGKLTYKSGNTRVVTVDDKGTVTIKGAGTANITITAAETSTARAATKTVKVTVNKCTQTIAGAAIFTKTYGDKAFALGAKAPGKLTYKSGNVKVVRVNTRGTVTIRGAGTANITVSAAETANAKAVSKTVKVTVKKCAQTIIVTTRRNKLVTDKAFNLSAKLTGKAVSKLTYTSDKKAVAAVNAKGLVTIKGTGTAKITVKATASANAKAAANRIVTITVGKPKSVTVKSLKALKGGKATVTWTKNAAATGYQIQYSLKKSFAGARTVKINKASTVRATLTGLTKNKTYYVRVRTYKTIGKKAFNSDWSVAKTVKTMKK